MLKNIKEYKKLMKGILPELKGSVDNISSQYSVLHELNSRINHSNKMKVFTKKSSPNKKSPIV